MNELCADRLICTKQNQLRSLVVLPLVFDPECASAPPYTYYSRCCLHTAHTTHTHRRWGWRRRRWWWRRHWWWWRRRRSRWREPRWRRRYTRWWWWYTRWWWRYTRWWWRCWAIRRITCCPACRYMAVTTFTRWFAVANRFSLRDSSIVTEST